MSIKKTPRKSTKSGFSLVELLLVMTLLPILFFAVYTNFSTGLKLWTRVITAVPQEDLNIFHLKMRRDLESMARFSPIGFEGTAEEISFASDTDGIGRTRFFYDADKKIVVREMQTISQVYQEAQGTSSVLLQNVRSFEIAYLSVDPLQGGYAWRENWKPEAGSLPAAVRLSYSVESTPEKQEDTVFIPVGGKFS